MSAGFATRATAPLLNESLALLLVDYHFKEIGLQAACVYGEIQQAFAYLTNPRVGGALWVEGVNRSIVIINRRL